MRNLIEIQLFITCGEIFSKFPAFLEYIFGEMSESSDTFLAIYRWIFGVRV